MTHATAEIDRVAELLEGYAKRGVFRGFSVGERRGARANFRAVWHYDREFGFELDLGKRSVRVAEVLANVPADSTMYRELKAFVRSQHTDDVPAHRRIDTAKAEIRPLNRRGTVSLVLEVKDGDFGYGVRKLVHLVHEIFLTFLVDGNYYEYVVEAFDLDPDRI